ncbi:MAG: peptidyl-prolyl cis-trans isomerase [Clostridia bacterium]|nr:peptidyl-prolyl cis-trans isomerase [Clostridia bacterium]
MKKFIKILSLILAVALMAGVLVSCKKKRTGILLATYDGKDAYDGKVYSGDEDLANWMQYLTGYYYDYIEDGSLSNQQFGKLIVNTVVLHRVEDLDMQARGITIADEDIKEMFDYNKLNFDEYYEGGFEQFKKDSGLDDDFWMSMARYNVIENIIREDQLLAEDIGDDELRAYFNNNFANYMKKAGYDYTAIFVEVNDVSDETEWNGEKANAEAYLSRIKDGEKFEDIFNEIKEKYSTENGYSQSNYASGFGTVELTNVAQIDDLEKALEDVKEKYPNADRNAEKSSEAYADYLRYLSACMGMEQSYAMAHMNVGDVYPTPIATPIGWMILRLETYREKNEYPSFEEMRYQVYLDYCDELMESNELMSKYKELVFAKYNVNVEDVVFNPTTAQ